MIAIPITVMAAMGLWLAVLAAYAIDLNLPKKKKEPTTLVINIPNLFQYLIINGEPVDEKMMKEIEAQVSKQILNAVREVAAKA